MTALWYQIDLSQSFTNLSLGTSMGPTTFFILIILSILKNTNSEESYCLQISSKYPVAVNVQKFSDLFRYCLRDFNSRVLPSDIQWALEIQVKVLKNRFGSDGFFWWCFCGVFSLLGFFFGGEGGWWCLFFGFFLMKWPHSSSANCLH